MPNERPAILVDLDRTLLDTPGYTAELWKHIAEHIPGLDAKAESDRGAKGEYYIRTDSSHTQTAYSLEAHIRDLFKRQQESFNDQSVQLLLAKLDESFPDATAFLYDHAKEVLTHLSSVGDVSIITFGMETDQRAKLKRLPTIASVPAIVIQEDKGTYIGNNFPLPVKVWLIDDKPYVTLPSNCRLILIAHEPRPGIEQDGIIVVRSLREAEHALLSNSAS